MSAKLGARALLGVFSVSPTAAEDLLADRGDRAVLKLCGYGRPDLLKARTSDENRVVLP